MNTIKQTLFHNWHFMRWVRLGMAIFIAVEAIQMQNIYMAFFVVFFLYQALTNTGGCGVGGCSVPVNKKKSDELHVVKYEEIK